MATSRWNQFFSSSIFKDIRFWIVLYFLIRLFHITQPPLETAHSWRQSTGLMVSRNFYEISPDILHPRVDMAGEKTGITGTEFPLFNYLIYLFAKIFGWADWYGRLINLIVSSFGVYWFYLLVLKYVKKETAFFATFILLNSLWFAYSRKTMPDTFAVSLAMGGLYYGLNFLKNGNWLNATGFFILVLCGLLSKIPSGFLLVVLILPFLDGKIPLLRKAVISVLFLVLMVPVYWWYFTWVPYLVKEFGFWHYYMGTSMSQGAKEISAHLDEAFEKFYFPALNWIGFFLFLSGLFMAIVRREKKILWVFGLCFATFLVFIMKAGFAFYHHNYYILPFVPIMALLAGYVLSIIPSIGIKRVLALAVAIEIIINALPEFHTNSDQKYKLTLETLAEKNSSRNELIAINCGPNPQEIYLSHRKGWNLEYPDQTQTSYIALIKSKGCKILIINKHDMPVPPYPFQKIDETNDFTVYRL